MRIDQMITPDRTTLSFEFFPPKTDAGLKALGKTVSSLAGLGPDFMTVTYGAGGSSREATLQVLQMIAERTGIPTVGHLTCVGHTKDELRQLLDEWAAVNVVNVLALRGDQPGGGPFQHTDGGCRYANELIELVRDDGRFAIACAAFTEGHPEASDRDSDWGYLAGKFAAGACAAISQLFFDAATWSELNAWLQQHHPDQAKPILPGILPITDWHWLVDFRDRFCPSASIPEALRARLEPLADDPVACRREGLAATIELCRDLLAAGAPGLHIYSLNQPTVAAEIVTALRAVGALNR